MECQRKVQAILGLLTQKREQSYFELILVNFVRLLEKVIIPGTYSDFMEDLENLEKNLQILEEQTETDIQRTLQQNILRIGERIEQMIGVEYFGEDSGRLPAIDAETQEQKGILLRSGKYNKIKDRWGLHNILTILFMVSGGLEDESFVTFSAFMGHFAWFVHKKEGLRIHERSYVLVRDYLDKEMFNKLDFQQLDTFFDKVWCNLRLRRPIVSSAVHEESTLNQHQAMQEDRTIKYEGQGEDGRQTDNKWSRGTNHDWLADEDDSVTPLHKRRGQQMSQVSVVSEVQTIRENTIVVPHFKEPSLEPSTLKDCLSLTLLQVSKQSHMAIGHQIVIDKKGLVSPGQSYLTSVDTDNNAAIFGRQNKKAKRGIQAQDVLFAEKDKQISRNQFMICYNYLFEGYFISCISTSNPTELIVNSSGSTLKAESVLILGSKETFVVKKIQIVKESQPCAVAQEVNRHTVIVKERAEVAETIDDKTVELINRGGGQPEPKKEEEYAYRLQKAEESGRHGPAHTIVNNKSLFNPTPSTTQNDYCVLTLECKRGQKKDQQFLFKGLYRVNNEIQSSSTEIKVGTSMDNDIIFMNDVVEPHQCSLVYSPASNSWSIFDSNRESRQHTRLLLKTYHQQEGQLTSHSVPLHDHMLIRVQDYVFQAHEHK